jgi:hypothetical protein
VTSITDMGKLVRNYFLQLRGLRTGSEEEMDSAPLMLGQHDHSNVKFTSLVSSSTPQTAHDMFFAKCLLCNGVTDPGAICL